MAKNWIKDLFHKFLLVIFVVILLAFVYPIARVALRKCEKFLPPTWKMGAKISLHIILCAYVFAILFVLNCCVTDMSMRISYTALGIIFFSWAAIRAAWTLFIYLLVPREPAVATPEFHKLEDKVKGFLADIAKTICNTEVLSEADTRFKIAGKKLLQYLWESVIIETKEWCIRIGVLSTVIQFIVVYATLTISFASTFFYIYLLAPNNFSIAVINPSHLFTEFTIFSLGVMTTMDFGFISGHSLLVRILSGIELVSGLLLLSVIFPLFFLFIERNFRYAERNISSVQDLIEEIHPIALDFAEHPPTQLPTEDASHKS